LFVTTVYYIFAIVLLPVFAVSVAGSMSRYCGKLTDDSRAIAVRYSFALVPIGLGMWLAHYSFHLFTSYDTIIPAMQRFAEDHGLNMLGAPLLTCACCRKPSDWVPHFEILMLDFGLLLSLYTGFRISEANAARLSQAAKAFLPWALLICLLFGCGVWIVLQPMEMRGTLPPSLN
jgi:hypothetical protein